MYKNYFKLREISTIEFKLQAHVFEILPEDKNINILDVGCGLCRHLSQLKKLGYKNLKGIDVNLDAALACSKYGIEFEKIDSILEFAKNNQHKYDFIIFAHVLEHLHKNSVIDTLKAIKSMLTSNGTLYIVVPNGQSNTNCYWAYEDFTHFTLYTSGSLMYVLKSAGFNNVNFIDPEALSGLKPIKRILRKYLLKIYKLNYNFWNRVTFSQFQPGSPLIFSFELKAIAKK